MKAILKFGLPEDTTEFHSAVNGGDALAVLSELDNWLRSKLKYADDGTPQAVLDAFHKSRTRLGLLLEEHEVSISSQNA